MKSGSLVRMVWAMSFLLPVGFAAAERPASACETAIREVVDTSSLNIASAERALSEGRYAAAVVGVSKAFPNIKKMNVGAGPLVDRGLRILALAAARADGALNVAKIIEGNTDEQKSENLLFAIDTLRKLNAKRANNPSFQTDLAEALSKVPRFKAEALEILNGLAKKDLVASPEGYAALAKIRDNVGDKEGTALAVKRCAGMTKKATTCVVDSADASSRS
jgi:hypothetical protein